MCGNAIRKFGCIIGREDEAEDTYIVDAAAEIAHPFFVGKLRVERSTNAYRVLTDVRDLWIPFSRFARVSVQINREQFLFSAISHYHSMPFSVQRIVSCGQSAHEELVIDDFGPVRFLPVMDPNRHGMVVRFGVPGRTEEQRRHLGLEIQGNGEVLGSVKGVVRTQGNIDKVGTIQGQHAPLNHRAVLPHTMAVVAGGVRQVGVKGVFHR